MVQTQSARAQRHLGAAFFAGDVQGIFARALQRVERLQEQGGFSDAGIPADQNHAAFHNAAAQNPVKLFVSGGCALDIAGLDVG